MQEYSDEEIKKLDEEYYALLEKNLHLSFKDFAAKINSLKIEQKNKIYFQRKMLNDYLGFFCGTYVYYSTKQDISNDEDAEGIFKTIELLPKDYDFWWEVYYFFKGDYKNLNLQLHFNKFDKKICTSEIVNKFIA